jgi:hypothetical protein
MDCLLRLPTLKLALNTSYVKEENTKSYFYAEYKFDEVFNDETIELFKSLCECIEKIVLEPIFKLEVKNNNMLIKIICSNNSKNINLDICVENIFGRFKKIEKPLNLGIGLKYLNDIYL